MDRLVIDSSVVIKWFVTEAGSAAADQILEGYQRQALSFLAPDLLFAEVGNIVWKKCRSGALELDEGQAIINVLGIIRFATEPSFELLPEAYRLATEHQRTVYDSLYVALSLREQVPFLTADKKLVNAIQRDLPNVVLLGDYTPGG